MPLFTNNHQVNFDEAMRRLEIWLDLCQSNPSRSLGPLKTLCKLLAKERDNLYFEPGMPIASDCSPVETTLGHEAGQRPSETIHELVSRVCPELEEK